MVCRLYGRYRLSLKEEHRMLASVYIKDGNIHFYNENNIFSNFSYGEN